MNFGLTKYAHYPSDTTRRWVPRWVPSMGVWAVSTSQSQHMAPTLLGLAVGVVGGDALCRWVRGLGSRLP